MFFKGCEIFSEKCKGCEILSEKLRGLKKTWKILRCLKIFPSEKNKGCETIRGAKFSSARENKRCDFFLSHLNFFRWGHFGNQPFSKK